MFFIHTIVTRRETQSVTTSLAVLAVCGFSLHAAVMLVLLLQLVGAVCAARLLFAIVRWFYVRMFYSFDWHSQFGGRWALVSGASAGTGKALAVALAARGLRVCAVGRDLQTLKPVIAQCLAASRLLNIRDRDPEMNAEYHRAVVADLTDIEPAMRAIREQTSDITGEILVLVNNLGGSGGADVIEEFIKTTPKLWEDVRKLNVDHTLYIMREYLPNMVKANHGAVINISTQASTLSPCMVSSYASDKAKINCLTAAVAVETAVRAPNVAFGVAIIGEVATPSNGFVESDPIPSSLIVTPEAVGTSVLRYFGSSLVYTPCLVHDLSGLAGKFLPHSLFSNIALNVMHEKKDELAARRRRKVE